MNYVDNSNYLIVDSGATNHVCSSLYMLSKTRTLKEMEFPLWVGNGESISAEAVREARLGFGKNFLLLDNVYFIPNISRNLISVFELYKQSFAVCSNNNEIMILHNGVQISCAKLENGLYVLHSFESQNCYTEIFIIEKPKFNKCEKLWNNYETYL